MKKRNKLFLVLLSTFLLLPGTACDKSSNDFTVGSLSFTCIESGINQRLFVCDQTNVIYLINGNHSSYTALIKEDGTAYTLDDYKKDCSEAKLYREDK